MSYDPNFLEYLGGLETKPAAVTKKQMKKTTDAVLKKTALKRKPSAAKQCGRILLIAAAVVAGAAVTAAASGVNLGGLFRGYFEGNESSGNARQQPASSLTESQIGVLDQSGAVLNQSVTDSGTTITVKAAVSDKSSAYILLDVIAPSGTVLDRADYTLARNDACEMEITESGGQELGKHSWSDSWDYHTLKDPNPKDNQKSIMLQVVLSGIDLGGKEVHLSFKNLSVPGKSKLELVPVLKGTWDFTVPLGIGKVKTIDVNQAVHHSGTYSTIAKISLSALSATVDFTGQNLNGKDGFIIPELIIIHKDGAQTKIKCIGVESGNKTRITSIYLLDAPIDPTEVSAVKLGDLTIPVS